MHLHLLHLMMKWKTFTLNLMLWCGQAQRPTSLLLVRTSMPELVRGNLENTTLATLDQANGTKEETDWQHTLRTATNTSSTPSFRRDMAGSQISIDCKYEKKRRVVKIATGAKKTVDPGLLRASTSFFPTIDLTEPPDTCTKFTVAMSSHAKGATSTTPNGPRLGLQPETLQLLAERKEKNNRQNYLERTIANHAIRLQVAQDYADYSKYKQAEAAITIGGMKATWRKLSLKTPTPTALL
uniref:Uncharacterized protein n=1 Tax=Plectus sambesii TaxID=2011161 RepID=A0A914XM44_9BILA